MKNKIGEWLESQGYPLEMAVARAFKDAGYRVQLSHYYADPEDDTLREIDVVATSLDKTGCIEITFVVECKVSRKRPWLLFSIEHELEYNRLFTFSISSDSARSALADKGAEKIMRLPWMKKEGRTAYGVTQAFGSGMDSTFKATTSVLKAAIARKRDWGMQGYEVLGFVFPVIIVDALLFECHLSDAGEVIVDDIDSMDLFSSWKLGKESGTCIRVLTSASIPSFVAETRAVTSALESLLENDAWAMLENI